MISDTFPTNYWVCTQTAVTSSSAKCVEQKVYVKIKDSMSPDVAGDGCFIEETCVVASPIALFVDLWVDTEVATGHDSAGDGCMSEEICAVT